MLLLPDANRRIQWETFTVQDQYAVQFIINKGIAIVSDKMISVMLAEKTWNGAQALNPDSGQIETNAHLQTNVTNIYAIGDVVKGAMLAHKAEEEGTMVAEIIAGQKPHIDYNLIPGVVYTWPEVAAVGKTEEQLKEAGTKYKSGTFAMRALGRARASMDIDGQIKVLADAETDEILGVHMIGARAADMIAEAVIAMEFRASSEDIARSSHAHPTYTEAFKEACLAVHDRAIHS